MKLKIALKLKDYDHRLSARIAAPPDTTHPTMQLLSSVAKPGVIFALAATLALYGVLGGMTLLATFGLSVFVTLSACLLLKLIVRRVRPDTSYAQAQRKFSYSFPSGHSAGISGLLGAFALAMAPELPELWGAIAVGGALCIILFVAYSRVYLGAHYVSDVIAGIFLGLGGVLLCYTLLDTYINSINAWR